VKVRDDAEEPMTSTLEKEILAQEERLTLATRALDLDALASIYADDIMFTGVTGASCDKSSLMDEARRGLAQRQAAAETKHFVASFEKDDIKVVVHGDTAVTSYRFVVTIQNNEQETKRRFRTTNVWMKRRPGWQVMAGHTASLDAVSV
jgi:ketosteroid isomerase-like protein